MAAPAWMKNLPTAPILGWRPGANGKPMLITYPGEKGLITVAPNRTGKGASVLGVNAVNHRSSLVLVDPKGENSDQFARWRALGLGQPTYVYDPLLTLPNFCLPAPAPGRPIRAGFNPIEMIRKSRYPVADAKMVANALIPIEGNNPFFSRNGQRFFASAACFVALDPHYPHARTMRSLWRDLTQQTDADFKLYLDMMAESPVCDGFAARGAISWLSGSTDATKSVSETLKGQAGSILDDPHILDCLSYTSLDFGQLTQTPISVFLILPGWAGDIYSSFMRLILSCMFAQIERAGLPPPGVKRPKTLIIFDEFSSLGRSDTIREAVPRLPGYGVQFWPLVQDFNQLKILYGDGWETFISNVGVTQFFGGASDNFTAEYLSRMTGTKTVPTTTVNQNLRIDGGGVSTGSTGRPLLFPNEISTLNKNPADKFKQVLLFSGSGMAYAQRLLFFRDFPPYVEFMKRHGADMSLGGLPRREAG